MFKHILIPTDGSELSTKAVERGIDLARATGAKITVLTVIEPFRVLATDSRRIAATRKSYEQHARQQADDALRQAERQAKQQGVPCTVVCTEGDQPYQAIIDVATRKRCDLIAMASHGRKGVAALVLGSETSKVLTHSRIPVLVYR